MTKIIPILLALTAILAACAPQTAPTMTAADIQGTAISAAWTVVAATKAAIPTITAGPAHRNSQPDFIADFHTRTPPPHSHPATFSPRNTYNSSGAIQPKWLS